MPFQSLVNQTMAAQSNIEKAQLTRKIADYRTDDLVQMYDDGLKIKDIARISGHSIPGLHNRLRDAGVVFRRKVYRLSDETKRLIIIKRKQGFTMREISRRLGVSVSAAYSVAKNAQQEKEQKCQS